MILQYKDFFKSWENFIQIRPDLLHTILINDFHSILKSDNSLFAKAVENFYAINNVHDYIDLPAVLSFAKEAIDENVYLYYIRNIVAESDETDVRHLLISKVELDINSGHYTNEYNKIELIERDKFVEKILYKSKPYKK